MAQRRGGFWPALVAFEEDQSLHLGIPDGASGSVAEGGQNLAPEHPLDGPRVFASCPHHFRDPTLGEGR